ncbi:MAG: single-stranded DNA-binding protein [Bacteroidota bacterium]
MKGNNTVQLIGYVGNDLRILKGQSNRKVLIRVATHDKYKDASGVQKQTTAWHDIAAWGKVGEFCRTVFCKRQPHLGTGQARFTGLMLISMGIKDM